MAAFPRVLIDSWRVVPEAIHSVTVASHPADFVYYDPLANLNISNPLDCHNHPELKRKLYSALAEGDEGELSIAIPKEVSLRQSGHATSGVVSEGACHLFIPPHVLYLDGKCLSCYARATNAGTCNTVQSPNPRVRAYHGYYCL